MADPTESYIEVKDGAFKIRLLQAGTGSPLIYIHGAGGLFWDPLLAGLADQLPKAVDSLTPEGRIPAPQDMSRVAELS